MAFVRTDVNFAAEYSKALANAYPYKMHFGAIWGSANSNLYKTGMGKTMYGDGEYTYETRGVMNNLMDALLSYPDSVDSWAVLRDNWSSTIDAELEKFNAAIE